MSFEALQAKVARAEDALEARERQVAADLRVFGGCWHSIWSPPRVVGAGLAAGFLAGFARPGRAVAGMEPARWLQLAGSVAGLAGTIQAAFAAREAKDAAEQAGDVAAVASGATAVPAGGASTATGGAAVAPVVAAGAARSPAGPAPAATNAPPSERRYVADPAWETPPAPAEAATEVSERR